ncbi:hypothetical protein AGMMS49983_18870 [Clostridia bacterium]|nr:hypothetical protein AGMMS49983_18780 [Clostridia bacterium]GHU67535.1 hypothetical protein AGMMS49983_18870 [Clostridia bacterium]
MYVSIRYFTRSGNTKKLADAIGNVLGVPALPISEKLMTPVDLLFLGGSVYGGKVDDSLAAFIDELNPEYVKKIAVFSTSAFAKSGFQKIKSLAEAKGIEVAPKNYYCPGKFLFLHQSRPNEEDCKAAALFFVMPICKRRNSENIRQILRMIN